jgi:hypothetical protein
VGCVHPSHQGFVPFQAWCGTLRMEDTCIGMVLRKVGGKVALLDGRHARSPFTSSCARDRPSRANTSNAVSADAAESAMAKVTNTNSARPTSQTRLRTVASGGAAGGGQSLCHGEPPQQIVKGRPDGCLNRIQSQATASS